MIITNITLCSFGLCGLGIFTNVYIACNLLAQIGFVFFGGNVKSKFIAALGLQINPSEQLE